MISTAINKQREEISYRCRIIILCLFIGQTAAHYEPLKAEKLVETSKAGESQRWRSRMDPRGNRIRSYLGGKATATAKESDGRRKASAFLPSWNERERERTQTATPSALGHPVASWYAPRVPFPLAIYLRTYMSREYGPMQMAQIIW